MVKKRRNVSTRVPNGRTVQTRDDYLFGQGSYRKPGYENKGNYRKAVVVDSNRYDELAIVKLTTSERGKAIEKSNSKYRPYVVTRDDCGNAIVIGRKFVENKKRLDLSFHNVNVIKKDLVKNCENRKRFRSLKGRKK